MTVARDFLVEIGPPPSRPDPAVLLVAAGENRAGVAEILAPLVASGHTVGLEDYDGDPAPAPLLAQCAIVRVDVARRDAADLARLVATAPRATVLWAARHVEDHAAFERCRGAGFASFQGEFFSKPRIVVHRGV